MIRLQRSIPAVLRVLGVTLVLACGAGAVHPAPASAGLCGAVGAFSGWAGKACSAVTHPDKIIKAGKSLATGHVGKAVKAITSSGAAKGAIGLAALVTWVTVGAKSALNATAGVIKKTTTPQLGSTWFSGMYWRMTAIAALLTLPFLFAAAGQAIVRSDLALLSRSALGYLPLSLLAVSIAAPVTMLLLTATDQLSAVVSAAAGRAGSRFLTFTGQQVATLDPIGHAAYLKFLIAVLASAAAVVLWIEMLMREAAVYIVVLMLPVAFAAMVWPARRVWATRIAEVLVALIVAKFVIVAILALGGAALGPAGGTTGLLIGLVLVTLAAFSPWALLRVLPLAELASGAAGHLRAEAHSGFDRLHGLSDQIAGRSLGWAGDAVTGMQRDAETSADGAPALARPAYNTDAAGSANDDQATSGQNAADGGPETAGAVGPAAGVGDTGAANGARAGVGDTGAANGAGPGSASGAGAGTANGPPAVPFETGGPATTDDASADQTGRSAAPGADAPAQRSPGMPDIYQADDLSQPTLVLGLEGLPAEPLDRRQAKLRADRDEPGEGGADEIDPRPGAQEPDGGLL